MNDELLKGTLIVILLIISGLTMLRGLNCNDMGDCLLGIWMLIIAVHSK